MVQKLKHASISLKKCQIVCLVIRIPDMYSLTNVRVLVFKIHKIIGQSPISNLYRGRNLKLLRF